MPGQHEVALAVPVLEQRVVAQRQRPRADEAHLAAQDVEHVRDLVEREAPQEPPDARHARVVADLEQRAARPRSRAPARPAGSAAPATIVRNLSIPNSLLAETDARGRGRRPGPREVELDRRPRSRARAAGRSATTSRRRRGRTSRLTAQSVPAKTGGRSSNSGTPWPGTYSPRWIEQLGRLRRDPHLHARAVRVLDDLEQLAVRVVRVGDDQLVGGMLLEHGPELVDAAEPRQARRPPRR